MLDSANGKPISLSPKLKTLYRNDIDMEKLLLHLRMLQDVVKGACLDGITIKQVTTLCDIFNHQPDLKKILTEVHKFWRIYLTIPVTTSTAERSFSALKRVKIRNSMTQGKLNHCMLLHMHHERTDTLDLVDIAKEFVSRCRNFFGNF